MRVEQFSGSISSYGRALMVECLVPHALPAVVGLSTTSPDNCVTGDYERYPARVLRTGPTRLDVEFDTEPKWRAQGSGWYWIFAEVDGRVLFVQKTEYMPKGDLLHLHDWHITVE